MAHIAHRLTEAVRPGDRVARLDSADFGLLVGIRLRQDVDALARRLLDRANLPVFDASQRRNVVASLGAVALPPGGDADQIVGRARRASVRARETGGSGYCYVQADEGVSAQAKSGAA